MMAVFSKSDGKSNSLVSQLSNQFNNWLERGGSKENSGYVNTAEVIQSSEESKTALQLETDPWSTSLGADRSIKSKSLNK